MIMDCVRSFTPKSGSRACALLLVTVFSIPIAFGASGSIDLHLQNNQLQPGNQERDSQNIVYYGVYTMGTPAQQFLGCFDTGSGDTWVPSIDCASSVCRSHDRYNPTSSSTYQGTPTTATIRYGTGSVALRLVYDTVTMAGITIPRQGVGLATALTSDFNYVSCDGLVGLGFTSLSSTGAATPFVNMANSSNLDARLFALWISPTPGQEPAGQLTFGSIDSSKYYGQITYVPVSRQLYWEVALQAIRVGSNAVSVSVRSAIIDSGTTAIVMPTSDAAAIHAQIPGAAYWRDQGVWNVSCNVGALPNVTFQFSGIACSVPASLYVQALTDTNGNTLGICASAITGGSSYGSSVVLGSNFLRAWYTVYSLANGSPQVGFAPGAAQPSRSSGGRRRLTQEDNQLFVRQATSLKHPRVGDSEPEQGQSSGRRRLFGGQDSSVMETTTSGEQLPMDENDGMPPLFSRSHTSLKHAHRKWNSNPQQGDI